MSWTSKTVPPWSLSVCACVRVRVRQRVSRAAPPLRRVAGRLRLGSYPLAGHTKSDLVPIYLRTMAGVAGDDEVVPHANFAFLEYGGETQVLRSERRKRRERTE